MGLKDSMRDWQSLRDSRNLERIANAAEGKSGPEFSPFGKALVTILFILFFHFLLAMMTVTSVIPIDKFPTQQDWASACAVPAFFLGALMLPVVTGFGYWILGFGTGERTLLFSYFMGMLAVGWVPFFVARVFNAAVKSWFGWV